MPGGWIHEGKRPHRILELLADADDWVSSGEIREALDVEKDHLVSVTLYAMSERGLVEKRRYSGDGRQKEYLLTDEGVAMLETVES